MKAPQMNRWITKTPTQKIEGLRRVGQKLWFEYHCWEDKDSQDYPLWLHSHRKVKILGIAPNDGMDIPKLKERINGGTPINYRIKFADGLVAEAAEDEILDSRKQFSRPNPPKQEANK